MVLIAAIIILCCIAPLLAFSVREPMVPPDAYPIFLRLFAFNDYAGAMAMLVAMTLALAVPQLQQAVVRAADWVGAHPLHTAALAFAALALCARFVYLAHPLSMDEYAPYMQAHAFARGDLAARYDPALLDWLIPAQHQGTFIATNHATGEAVAMYWPGLALVMAPFVWLDATWCVNPAFGALALLLIHRLVSEATESPVAGGIALLAALASPQFTVNTISYYAMPGELALNLLFLWLLLRPGPKWAFAAGLAGGLSLIMHNPVPHGLMAIPCLLWLVLRRERWPRLIALLAGYLPFIVAGLGWALVMSAASTPRQTADASVGSTVAGLFEFLRSVLTLPSDYLLAAKWYATWKIWIWSAPGLLLLLFIPRRRGMPERLLIAGFALTFLFYFFVHYDQGHGWGYRYMQGTWAALPVVAGLWWAQAAERMRAVGAAAVAAGLLATPVFMWQTHDTIAYELSFRLNPPATERWAVFVAQDTGLYRGDLVQNPPGRNNLVYLTSRGPDADKALVAENFPGAVLEYQDGRGSAWRLPNDNVPLVSPQ